MKLRSVWRGSDCIGFSAFLPDGNWSATSPYKRLRLAMMDSGSEVLSGDRRDNVFTRRAKAIHPSADTVPALEFRLAERRVTSMQSLPQNLAIVGAK
jgi:hypothetical protein